MFWMIYWLDRWAHDRGYSWPRSSRPWWCTYAEDKLTRIYHVHNHPFDTDVVCPCKWCKRYQGEAPYA